MSKKEKNLLNEIKKIAKKLNKTSLTERDFKLNSKIGISVIYNCFGSWNRAIKLAGLEENEQIGETYTKEELLLEVIRLTKELKKIPSDREMNAMGKYSAYPYRRIWGKFTKGRDEAYKIYGNPISHSKKGKNIKENVEKNEYNDISNINVKSINSKKDVIKTDNFIVKSSPKKSKKKTQFGEPIAFRGLRFAPINEQGVVYLFGMVSREIGFLIESIRTEFPDCEGKRCVDSKKNLWEHVLIEFEYSSKNFKSHGHNPDDCDLIVCWRHDWEECPIEVLELKSIIKKLKDVD
jgi:hypothetical protein